MCPLCIATGSLLLTGAGTGSAGVLATVATRVLRGRKRRQPDESADVSGSTGAGADLTNTPTQATPQ